MKRKDDILTRSENLKKMPYSIPEGYFESLEAKVLDRIGQEGQLPRESGKKRVFPARFIPWLAAAAAVAIIVTLGITLGTSSRSAASPEDGLRDSDYVFYFAEIVPVTEPDAIYYSYNTDSDTYLYDENSDYDPYEGLSYEDIIEYLGENGVDISTLIHNLN